ncbi:hypothetical protein H2O64_08210 [Kordia sp. YSTF-M3]|uniref:Uncharacterized protein n=1 Tax=Kordia aestuariivivens TaxID=2759037 RepID=A0ABR7Q7X9_9FLAO|nr:hypothetical protein [Kordia aestuariivivens]MBC8754655.1 hypothetical protein [Kordia aestuariivivens]
MGKKKNPKNKKLKLSSEVFNKIANQEILIPGRLITKVDIETINNKNIPIDCSIYNMPNTVPINLPKFGFKSLSFESLTPPTSHAFLLKNPYKHIRICAVVFLGRSKNVKNKDFTLKYNVCLNCIGKYQLNIYIIFNTPEKSGVKYDFYSFDIRFLKKSIKLQELNNLPLSQVNTVEVFIINKDPKTSRGTVTTVQTHNQS